MPMSRAKKWFSSGLKSIHSLLNSEVLFLQYYFPCTTVKGLTLKEVPKALHITFKIHVCTLMKRCPLSCLEILLKHYFPGENSPMRLTNLVIKAMRDGNYNPCFFFLLFFMSGCFNLQSHVKGTNKKW